MRVAGAAAMLLVYRVAALAGHRIVWSPWAPAAYLWHDAVVLLAYAIADRALTRLPKAAWTTYVVFVAYAAGNIPIVRVMSTPMTINMWHAAGGALGDSIRHYLWRGNVAWIAAACALGLIARIRSSRVARVPRVACCAAGLISAVGPIAAARVDTRGFERNPWSALAASAMPRALAFSTDGGWRTGRVRLAPGGADDVERFRGAAAGRHVVLVGLESTAAQYLGAYGAAPDPMPNLSALARSAIVFDNAYAVYPESVKGLLSVLCSVLPYFDRPAESYARQPLPSFAAAVEGQGYRTALFHSGRFDYLGMRAVVDGRGFDVLEDAGDIGGVHESSFGVDDRATVARILAWIDRVPRGVRFFVTYLPIAGHHPYESPERGPFDERDEFGRYRNALHYADRALGDLRHGLASRGLDTGTLWVVYGDHGEAFGQHDANFGHTFQVYDENVHVPLLVALPGALDRGIRRRAVASLIDTAPTILDLLGIPAMPAFQGRSLLDGDDRMALFYADYSRHLLGLRDGPFKSIYDVGSGRSQLFDLDRDPHERVDLAGIRPQDDAWYARRLRQWFTAAKRAS